MNTESSVRSEAGFTLLQLTVVLALTMTVLGFSLGSYDQALATVRGDASLHIVQWQLKLAREAAINQRRAVEVHFTAPNFISVVRRDIPNGTTLLSTAVLEHRTEFHLFNNVPDTPDAFGHATPIDFGGAADVMFTAQGTLVDGNGAIRNGTIFIGRPGQPTTARAVTVFGPTAGIRTYRWNGGAWGH